MRTIACLVTVTTLLLTACSTSMTKDECRTVDWRTVGYEDGVAGRPGDRIAIHMAATFESVLHYLSSLFYGTILVPLNPRYTEEETRYFLEDADARLFICQKAGTSPGRPAGWRAFLRSTRGDLRECEQEVVDVAFPGGQPPSRIETRRRPSAMT